MKRILSLGILGLATICAISAQQVEKRYYFILGGVETLSDPNYIDYRIDDNERILDVWPDGTTLSGIPAEGPGIVGNEYMNFQVNYLDWWGMGMVVGRNNPVAEMDLTDVDETWSLHIGIRTDLALNFQVNLGGSSIDPDDPTLDQSESSYIFNRTNFPIKDRDKEWHEFDIPMSQFFNSSTVGKGGALCYKAPLRDGQQYLSFNGGNEPGAVIGLDNVYLTNNANGSGIKNINNDQLVIHYGKGQLVIENATQGIEVYNACGSRVYQTSENMVDMSQFEKGIYFARSGNKVAKFIK